MDKYRIACVDGVSKFVAGLDAVDALRVCFSLDVATEIEELRDVAADSQCVTVFLQTEGGGEVLAGNFDWDTMRAAPEVPMGSIISGTMREEDLIPFFIGVLEQYNTSDEIQFWRSEHEIIHGSDSYDSERASELLNQLFDALEDLAPENCYFGAHWGDGADFGFWPAELDDLDDEEGEYDE